MKSAKDQAKKGQQPSIKKQKLHGLKNITKIKELLDNNLADIDEYDKSGLTALFYADDIEVFKLLISYKANINIKNINDQRQTLIFHYIQKLKWDHVKLLINSQADINIRSNMDRTLLFYADNYDIARLLINKKANVNATDLNGYTPLFMNMKDDIIRLLIDNKANINHLSNDGSNALFQRHSIQSTKLLLESKIDLSIKNKDNITALTNASSNTLYLLYKYKADIEQSGIYFSHCTFYPTLNIVFIMSIHDAINKYTQLLYDNNNNIVNTSYNPQNNNNDDNDMLLLYTDNIIKHCYNVYSSLYKYISDDQTVHSGNLKKQYHHNYIPYNIINSPLHWDNNNDNTIHINSNEISIIKPSNNNSNVKKNGNSNQDTTKDSDASDNDNNGGDATIIKPLPLVILPEYTPYSIDNLENDLSGSHVFYHFIRAAMIIPHEYIDKPSTGDLQPSLPPQPKPFKPLHQHNLYTFPLFPTVLLYSPRLPNDTIHLLLSSGCDLYMYELYCSLEYAGVTEYNHDDSNNNSTNNNNIVHNINNINTNKHNILYNSVNNTMKYTYDMHHKLSELSGSKSNTWWMTQSARQIIQKQHKSLLFRCLRHGDSKSNSDMLYYILYYGLAHNNNNNNINNNNTGNGSIDNYYHDISDNTIVVPSSSPSSYRCINTHIIDSTGSTLLYHAYKHCKHIHLLAGTCLIPLNSINNHEQTVLDYILHYSPFLQLKESEITIDYNIPTTTTTTTATNNNNNIAAKASTSPSSSSLSSSSSSNRTQSSDMKESFRVSFSHRMIIYELLEYGADPTLFDYASHDATYIDTLSVDSGS